VLGVKAEAGALDAAARVLNKITSKVFRSALIRSSGVLPIFGPSEVRCRSLARSLTTTRANASSVSRNSTVRGRSKSARNSRPLTAAARRVLALRHQRGGSLSTAFRSSTPKSPFTASSIGR
jgi:hypothetical protein